MPLNPRKQSQLDKKVLDLLEGIEAIGKMNPAHRKLADQAERHLLGLCNVLKQMPAHYERFINNTLAEHFGGGLFLSDIQPVNPINIEFEEPIEDEEEN